MRMRAARGIKWKREKYRGNRRPSRNSLNTSSCCLQIYFGFRTATRQRKKNKTGQIRADRESESVRLIRDRRYIMAYVYPFDGRMAALRGIRLRFAFVPKEETRLYARVSFRVPLLRLTGGPIKMSRIVYRSAPRAHSYHLVISAA